ncbi:hypothetical protein ACSFA0_23935 [Variovorax sp. LT1P1]|uniref:hypothetical protein n=1 Tax=Variovorax sp. LT1P1 TaxID=3443730 RepID=UPI003F48996A
MKVQFSVLTLNAMEIVGICVDESKHSAVSEPLTLIEEFELRVMNARAATRDPDASEHKHC